MTNPRALAGAKTYIRCGTPDCDWGAPFRGLDKMDTYRAVFREHCVERHGLDPSDTERLCWFNLEVFATTGAML
jgi:hypothetical protein